MFSASHDAFASIASCAGRISETSSLRRGCVSGYTEPVSMRCLARDVPINQDRKHEEQASMTMARAQSEGRLQTTRMLAGKVHCNAGADYTASSSSTSN